MKKILITLVLFQGALFAQTTTETAPPQSPPVKPKSWIKDQTDQTDTYAVPLDTSEAEEEAEIEKFEEMKQPKNGKTAP